MAGRSRVRRAIGLLGKVARHHSCRDFLMPLHPVFGIACPLVGHAAALIEGDAEGDTETFRSLVGAGVPSLPFSEPEALEQVIQNVVAENEAIENLLAAGNRNQTYAVQRQEGIERGQIQEAQTTPVTAERHQAFNTIGQYLAPGATLSNPTKSTPVAAPPPTQSQIRAPSTPTPEQREAEDAAEDEAARQIQSARATSVGITSTVASGVDLAEQAGLAAATAVVIQNIASHHAGWYSGRQQSWTAYSKANGISVSGLHPGDPDPDEAFNPWADPADYSRNY